MWSTWKTLIVRNLLLITVIESINLLGTGRDVFGSANALLDVPNRVISDLYNRKMLTLFSRLDVDGDGIIRRKEYVGIAEKYADLENFDPTEKERARKALSDIFTLFTKASGKEDEDELTADLLIRSMQTERDDPQFKKVLDEATDSFLLPMKLEQEGYISYSEFLRSFANIGVKPADFMKIGFALIDADHDGRISRAESNNAAHAYMLSTDPGSTAAFGLI